MKGTVVLGFSGGVDSACAAALLRREGWDVRALYLENGSGEAESARACAEAMGLPEFDEAAFAAKVEEIQVPENGVLVFVFYDGHTVTKTWDNPSRRHSWNPENRQRARELALRQAAERRLAKCQQ